MISGLLWALFDEARQWRLLEKILEGSVVDLQVATISMHYYCAQQIFGLRTPYWTATQPLWHRMAAAIGSDDTAYEALSKLPQCNSYRADWLWRLTDWVITNYMQDLPDPDLYYTYQAYSDRHGVISRNYSR